MCTSAKSKREGPSQKGCLPAETRALSQVNPLLLNDRILFCGEETFEIHITIVPSITPTAGY